MFCVYSDYAEQRIFSKLGKKKKLFFKSQMSPSYLLIIVFPKFDPLTATWMDVKIYLAHTEYQRNRT